ncbi:hypothetical protein ACFYO2_34525 [Streptomyces sp. NPDC006602]|uniref:hypothetical protein n=1 Tax=Streptomyces sp. NPDC006602 TaxID=3364751 RepID=UPI0036C320DA
MDHEERVELVEKATAASGRPCPPQLARAVVAPLEQKLDDAAANHLLFSMALSLLDDQPAPKGRADLYLAFIEQLAARNGAADISAVRMALGIVFARLLNDGRRYADVYEWHHLLSQAASALQSVGLATDTSAVHEAARRCGLITHWDGTRQWPPCTTRSRTTSPEQHTQAAPNLFFPGGSSPVTTSACCSVQKSGA